MRLVTAPTAEVVTLAEMKLYLSVDHDDWDTMIASMISEAVADIDGWGGILGRCIMPQTWAFKAVKGDIESPMPDVIAATQGGVLLLTDGTFIAVPADGEVEITCALPERYLPKVRGIVQMMVADKFADRENGGRPAGAMGQIASMRWNQI